MALLQRRKRLYLGARDGVVGVQCALVGRAWPAVPIRSLRDFIRWLSIAAGLYGLDCLVATLEHEAPGVPWIARGVYAGYLFIFVTCAWLLAPLIFAIKKRIDTQPRG
jgi:hypothetical protein